VEHKEKIMLKLLRQKKVMKKILWALAIIIVPAFVLWGAGRSPRQGPQGPKYIGKIFGKKVSFEKFSKSYEISFQQMWLAYAGNNDLLRQMKESGQIYQMAWDRLIMLAEAKKQGIDADDKEVISLITETRIFSRGGVFDNKFYSDLLINKLRTSPRKYEEGIRENLIITKLRDRVTEDIGVTDVEILKEYNRRNEKAEVSYFLSDPEDFKKGIELTDEEIKVYYDKSSHTFKKGEEVSIRYLYIKEDQIDLVNKITDEVAEGGSFDEIAEENSLEVSETPFFGRSEEIPEIGWSFDVINAAFSLKEGMTSFPIYTSKGYYIISLKEKRTGYLPSLEDVKDDIEKILIKEKSIGLAKDSAIQKHKDIEEAMKDGSSFEKAAKKLKVKIEKTKPFSRKDYIEGIGQAQFLKAVAFNSVKDKINAPIKCEKGFVAFRVDKTTPPDEEKFEEEKEKIKDQLLMQKKNQALNTWFAKLQEDTELEVDLDLLP